MDRKKWLFYYPADSNNNSLQMIQLMLTYLRIPATKLYSLLIPIFVSILVSDEYDYVHDLQGTSN